MATSYNLANIRILLTEGFSDAELRRFCYDAPEFRAVYDGLAANTGKAEIIDHLLEFAERWALLTPLLAWTKQQNPAQYNHHQPYLVDVGASRRLAPTSDAPISRPLRVFFCHASADKPAVRDLYERLSGEGFIQPWLDEEELLPGQDWQLEIPKAVRASDVVLVCLSPQSITKAGYVQKEIKFALDIADEQPEGTIFLIPLRLEACDVPERLRKWQWANLFEARGYERLLRALRKRVEAINVTLRPQAEESLASPLIPESPRPTATPSTPPPVKPVESRGTPNEVRSDTETAPTPRDRLTLTTPIHLELVRVPAGEFLMGSDPAKDKDAWKDQQPQHCVYVSEFYIGRYLVTNEQYAVFVRETQYKAPGHWEQDMIPAGKEDHPVVGVSWEDTVAFCKWLSQASGQSFRLPTEAEWEKAARGTDGRKYPWGNQWDSSKLNSKEGGPGDTTTPVGHYSPGGDSPYGVADMCGNVWEWCSTVWQEKAYPFEVQDEWVETYLNRRNVRRVLRGGTFHHRASYVRCAVRFKLHPRPDWSIDLSFRVVLPAK